MANRKHQFVVKHGRVVRRGKRRREKCERPTKELRQSLNRHFRSHVKRYMKAGWYDSLPTWRRDLKHEWWILWW